MTDFCWKSWINSATCIYRTIMNLSPQNRSFNKHSSLRPFNMRRLSFWWPLANKRCSSSGNGRKARRFWISCLIVLFSKHVKHLWIENTQYFSETCTNTRLSKKLNSRFSIIKAVLLLSACITPAKYTLPRNKLGTEF